MQGNRPLEALLFGKPTLAHVVRRTRINVSAILMSCHCKPKHSEMRRPVAAGSEFYTYDFAPVASQFTAFEGDTIAVGISTCAAILAMVFLLDDRLSKFERDRVTSARFDASLL